MLSKEDAVRLHHMLEAAREAVGFSKDRTRADLDADRQLTHSLIRCIEITGEAANRVSEKFRDTNTQVPWANLITMRHRLIHVYFNIDLNILWRTVTQELPTLIPQLEGLLKAGGYEALT